MNTFPIAYFLELFDELYISATKQHTWVIDNKPGTGLFDSIQSLSAAQASLSTHENGTTVASHTEHLRWSLVYALTFLQGKVPEHDWSKSWTVKEVDEKEWAKLQQDIKKAYSAVRDAVTKTTDWSNELLFNGAMSLLPHAAYHLGAVKQLILAVKDK